MAQLCVEIQGGQHRILGVIINITVVALYNKYSVVGVTVQLVKKMEKRMQVTEVHLVINLC